MIRTLTPLALAFTLLTECTTEHPQIANLKYDPNRYQNHSITVDNVITNSQNVPLVPFKLYKIDDGTKKITIISQDGRAPNKKTRINVKNQITEFSTFDNSSIKLHLQQEHLKYKNY